MRNNVLGDPTVLLAALGVLGTGTGWPDITPACCALYTGVSRSDVSEPLALMLALIGGVGSGLAVGCLVRLPEAQPHSPG